MARRALGKDDEPVKVSIFINRSKYLIKQQTYTGRELRELPIPAIPDDKDLWRTVGPEGPDVLVQETDRIEVESGMVFYTVPRIINAGARRNPHLLKG
jgi:hypothetical protein